MLFVEGRSGAGKTVLAELLDREGVLDPVSVVHMDDLYPGWDGLQAGGRRLVEEILEPLVAARARHIATAGAIAEQGTATSVSYRKWDWHEGKPADELTILPVTGNVIIEGCGCLTHAAVAAAAQLGHVMSVDLVVPEVIRRQRALRRSPEMQGRWEMWAAQENSHRQDMPVADFVLRGE